MALNVHVPVALPYDSADLITNWGSGTATLYLEYGTATTPADGTATTLIVSGTEQYEFWVETAVNSYFRYRIGDGTDYTSYSATWQQPQAYATLQEVVRALDFPDASRYDEIETLLLDATDHITNVICGGRSFFRDPVGSGTAIKTLNLHNGGQSKLSLARGAQLDIVSLTTVEVASYTGATYDTISAGSTGYYLLPDDPKGRPYSDLALSDVGTLHSMFPTGWGTVRLTGVFGWESVPDLVRRATVDLVRAWWETRGRDGEPVGLSAFGAPIFSGYPRSVRDLARSDYAWKDWVA